MTLHIISTLQQQPARPRSPVAYMLLRLGLHDFSHEVRDFSRSVKFAARLASFGRKVPYQVLVSVAEQVIVNACPVEGQAAEVIDDCDQLGSRQAVLCIEIDCAIRKDTVELRLVRTLDCTHGVVERRAEL